MPTPALLNLIRSLGYAVSVFDMPASLLGTVGPYVEMHAVDHGAEPAVVKIARVQEAEATGDAAYRCTCLLAESVGIELDG